jgi:hypothetical protein
MERGRGKEKNNGPEVASRRVKNGWPRLVLPVFTVIIIVPILLWVVYDDPEEELKLPRAIELESTGYKAFPINVSFEPGDIVAIDSSGQLEALLVGRDMFVAVDSTSVQLSDEQNVPSYLLERKNEFSSQIGAAAPAAMRSQLVSVISGADYVHQRVDAGYSVRLRNGTSAVSAAFRNLPRSVLEDLYHRQEREDAIVLISDVLTYADASFELKWSAALSSDIQSKIKQVVNIGSEGQWIADDKFLIRYEEPVSVGFKSVPVPRVDPDWASLPTWYFDADGDGYGGMSPEPLRASGQPDGYVLASGDCLDTGGSVHPGQDGWFSSTYVTSNGSPSWDYNCNGHAEKRWTVMQGGCRGNGTANQGWTGSTPPRCGDVSRWLSDCDRKLSGLKIKTVKEYKQRRQQCR